MLTCSILPEEGVRVESEERRQDGLLYLHEYAILDLVDPLTVPASLRSSVGLTESLIKLRNPHGKVSFHVSIC